MSRFKVGDKVVCINDTVDPRIKEVFGEWVIKDKEYTVRGTRNGLHGHFGVLLEEIKNKSIPIPELGGKAEPGFAEWRFSKRAIIKLSKVFEKEEALLF